MSNITRFPIEVMKTTKGYELRHSQTAWILEKPTGQTSSEFYDFVNHKAFELAVKLNATAVCEKKWYPGQNLTVVN